MVKAAKSMPTEIAKKLDYLKQLRFNGASGHVNTQYSIIDPWTLSLKFKHITFKDLG